MEQKSNMEIFLFKCHKCRHRNGLGLEGMFCEGHFSHSKGEEKQ